MSATEIKQVEVEIEKIKSAEKAIEREEARLETLEEKLIAKLDKTDADITDLGRTSRLSVWRASLARKLSKHKILYSVLISFGVVQVWRGLWDWSETIPWLASPFIALAIGLAILWLTKRYSDLEE